MPSCLPRRSSGFTLIELMIVVAIVAILASIAMPSYTSYIAKGRRADARGQLMQAAQFMQRFYAANDRFDKDRAENEVLSQMPANLKRAPSEGEKMYDLSVLATASDYTLTMAPVGSAMAADSCGSFRLDAAGRKKVVVNGVENSSTLRDTCWK